MNFEVWDRVRLQVKSNKHVIVVHCIIHISVHSSCQLRITGKETPPLGRQQKSHLSG